MANKSKKMNFQWNYGKDAIVQRLGFGADLNRVFAETLVEKSIPYTPYGPSATKDVKEHLRGGVEINANHMNASITYPDIVYAQYQYFSNDSAWNRHTAGTTSRWLEYAWTVHKQQIAGKVGAHRRWHSK
jgi:hypothetical protein